MILVRSTVLLVLMAVVVAVHRMTVSPVLAQALLAPVSGMTAATITGFFTYLAVREQVRGAHRRAEEAEKHAEEAKEVAHTSSTKSDVNTERIDALAERKGVMGEMRDLVERQHTQLVQMAESTSAQLERSTTALLECERGREEGQRQIERMRAEHTAAMATMNEQHDTLNHLVHGLAGELARLLPEVVAPPHPE